MEDASMPAAQRSIQARISLGDGTRTLAVPAGSSAGGLLRSLGLPGEEYTVPREDHAAYKLDKLGNGDRIELIRIFSGG